MLKYFYALLAFSLCISMILCGCVAPADSDYSYLSQLDFAFKDKSSSEESEPSSEEMLPSSEVTSEPEPPKPDFDSVPAGGYTVFDPNNKRGLSNEKRGCYFGVASGGKPHQLSVDNQRYFDSNPAFKALALDTKTEDNVMYLTFDCGYEYNNLTANILDTLMKKNVKAAFFCTLSYLKENPQLVKRMISEGHIVGNHSATHPTFTEISRVRMAEELYEVDKYLKDNFGVSSSYFRFPGGYHSDNTLELVSSVGYKSIFWSVAYSDWDPAKQPDLDEAFQTVTSRYHKGAVILLHAVSQTNADILSDLIDEGRGMGYTFKTLDDYYS